MLGIVSSAVATHLVILRTVVLLTCSSGHDHEMYVAGILNIQQGIHNSYLSSGREEPGHLRTVPSQPSQAEQTKTTIEHTDLRLHELLATLRHFFGLLR